MSDWYPTVFTPSLTGTEDFTTDGDRLIEVVEKYWRAPETAGKFHLDDWQKWLLRHVLEIYPEDWPEEQLRGRLRYRQAVISMGRQNGKSVLGGILGFYGLAMHERGPQVIGLASTADQANIIYNRVFHTINESAPLVKRFKTTGTRGISRRDGSGTYVVKPAKGDALQGIPISMCLFDELHISKEDMWQAVVNGQRARKNPMVIGLTTAGDDNSALLKSLYETGNKAATGDTQLERFGFFLWEAPEGSTTEDEEAIKAANPAIACGRIDIRTVQSDVRNLPEVDQQRYALNRFVASLSSWLPMSAWYRCEGDGVDPAKGGIVFAIDRSPSWEYATITAAQKVGDTIHTEVVASLVKPTLAQLVRIAASLRRYNGVFFMDGYQLPELGKELRQRGYKVMILSQKELNAACSTSYAKVVQGLVSHPNEALLRHQMPRAVRKNSGDAWRISRANSSVEIDAVMATVMGIYGAETQRKETVQMFV